MGKKYPENESRVSNEIGVDLSSTHEEQTQSGFQVSEDARNPEIGDEVGVSHDVSDFDYDSGWDHCIFV